MNWKLVTAKTPPTQKEQTWTSAAQMLVDAANILEIAAESQTLELMATRLKAAQLLQAKSNEMINQLMQAEQSDS